jgi:hypothetical protein
LARTAPGGGTSGTLAGALRPPARVNRNRHPEVDTFFADFFGFVEVNPTASAAQVV